MLNYGNIVGNTVCKYINMAKKKKTKKQRVSSQRLANALPAETRASDSLTVLWSVTVLMSLFINIACLAVHYYLAANPDAEKLRLLKGILLFTGTLVGGVSLILLPVLYRVRKVPPPPGLAFFGACVAAAPILAVLANSF